jgi:hypothetical protein
MEAAGSGTATDGIRPRASLAPGAQPPREIRKSLVERARRAGRQLADGRRANRVV